MADGLESRLSDAFDCLQPRLSDQYEVRGGMGPKLARIVQDILDEDLRFENNEHRITDQTVGDEIIQELKQSAEAAHGENDINRIEEFKRRKDDLMSRTLGADKNTYTIVFPLNIRDIDSVPDLISTSETEFKNISRDNWKDNYLDPALKADETTLEAFLDESPNDLDDRDSLGYFYTFWAASYAARDAHFATFQIQDITRLMLAKLNFVLKNRHTEVAKFTSSTDRGPRGRWSWLQEPYFYLNFIEGEYQNYWPMDYDTRRGPVTTGRDIADRIEQFEDIPLLGMDKKEWENLSEEEKIDRRLRRAFFSYQDGITEISNSQSFLSFWTGIETLTQGDNIVERARVALEVSHDPTLRYGLWEAMERLKTKRNAVAHKGAHVYISDDERACAKILLDGLLDFYLDNYSSNFSDDDYEILLEYGTWNPEQSERMKEVIQGLDESKNSS